MAALPIQCLFAIDLAANHVQGDTRYFFLVKGLRYRGLAVSSPALTVGFRLRSSLLISNQLLAGCDATRVTGEGC